MPASQGKADFHHIGVVLLSEDYRVIGMNAFARQTLGLSRAEMGKSVYDYHPPRSRPKIGALLGQSRLPRPPRSRPPEVPVAMIIDVLSKVLMISVSRLEMVDSAAGACFVACFVDVTEQTGAELNPRSGLVQLKKFPIYDRGSFFFLDTAAIYFFQSDGNYCKVRTGEGLHHIHATLKYILERHAGPTFFRVHKSYVANLDHVKQIKRDRRGRTFVVFDRQGIPSIPLARRRVGELKRALGLA